MATVHPELDTPTAGPVRVDADMDRMESSPLAGEDLEADVLLRSSGLNQPLCLTCTDILQNPAPAGCYCVFWNAVICVLAVGGSVLAYPHFRDSLVLFVPTDQFPTCSDLPDTGISCNFTPVPMCTIGSELHWNSNYLYLFTPWYLVFISAVHCVLFLHRAGVARTPCWWKAPRQYIRNQRLYAAAAAGDVDAVVIALNAGGEAAFLQSKWQPLLLCWLWEPPARAFRIYSALLLDWLNFFIAPVVTTWLYTVICHEGGDDGPRLDFLTAVLLPFQDSLWPGTVGCLLLVSPFYFILVIFVRMTSGVCIMAPVLKLVCKQSFEKSIEDMLSELKPFNENQDPKVGNNFDIGRILGAYSKHLYHIDLVEETPVKSAIEVAAWNDHVEVMAALVDGVGQWDQHVLDIFLDAFNVAVQHDSVKVVELLHDRFKVVEPLLAQGDFFTTSLPNDDHWLHTSITHAALHCAHFFKARGGDIDQELADVSQFNLEEGTVLCGTRCFQNIHSSRQQAAVEAAGPCGTLRQWALLHGVAGTQGWVSGLPELSDTYLRRYKKDGEPKYISETCSVWFAVDSDQTQVALKCMQDPQYFESEVTTRRELAESCADAIIPMLRVHVPESEHSSFLLSWGTDCVADTFTDDAFPYVVAMTRGERSLAEIIAHERVAGRELETIKRLARQIAEDLQILHASGLVHGDIKPSNLLREQDSRALKLIDFDASAHMGGSNDSSGACAEGYSSEPVRNMANTPWACGVCTFNNHQNTSTCGMCAAANTEERANTGAERYTVGQKAAGSSAYIPPEGAELLHDESLCLEAKYSYDCWMLGATIYELLTGCRLFSSERVDSDAIDPACLQDLINWSGLEARHCTQLLSDCSAPSIELEKENALDLLGKLLDCNAAARPTMDDILAHRFWRPAGDMAFTDPLAARIAVLGHALSLTTIEMRAFCETAAISFINTCATAVAVKSCGHSQHVYNCVDCMPFSHSWHAEVDQHALRNARWDRINGNATRELPLHCSVCKVHINRAPQPGDTVQTLNVPADSDAELLDWPVQKKDAWQGKLKVTIRGTEREGKFQFKPITAPSLVGCMHDSQDVACTAGSPGEGFDGHYDFCIHSAVDALHLFIPSSMEKHFQPDFGKQDATNLLNFIEALCPQLKADAEFVRREVRNKWAHQVNMDAKLFQEYINRINHLVAGMTSHRDAQWEQVDLMVAQWS